MFAAWCAAEGCEVLLSERRILALHHDDRGSDLAFRCWCGHVGHLRIERMRDRQPA